MAKVQLSLVSASEKAAFVNTQLEFVRVPMCGWSKLLSSQRAKGCARLSLYVLRSISDSQGIWKQLYRARIKGGNYLGITSFLGGLRPYQFWRVVRMLPLPSPSSGWAVILGVFLMVLRSWGEIFGHGDQGSTQNFDTNLMSIVFGSGEPFWKNCLCWLRLQGHHVHFSRNVFRNIIFPSKHPGQ